MQSVEISGLKEIQKKLEGYPEAMKKARSEFFEPWPTWRGKDEQHGDSGRR